MPVAEALHALTVPSAVSLPRSLSLQCAHPEAYRAVERYLGHIAFGLELLGPDPMRLTVHVVRPDDVPTSPPEATALVPRHQYAVARLDDELIYSAAGRLCIRVEPRAGRADVWTVAFDPDSVAEFVSIAVLGELASARGFFGLHAGAIVHEGLAYLFPGASGSGKSSLCLALMRAGFRYLTDDYLALRVDGNGVSCASFVRTLNIDPDWATRYPELSILRDLRSVGSGKRIFDPETCYPGSHALSARPAALVFPTIVPDESSQVRRLPQREAFFRLLPSIRLSADIRVADTHLRLLGALIRDCAAFELQHGRDFLRAPVVTIGRLFESLAHAPAPLAPR